MLASLLSAIIKYTISDHNFHFYTWFYRYKHHRQHITATVLLEWISIVQCPAKSTTNIAPSPHITGIINSKTTYKILKQRTGKN